jgi:ABC-type nickel/cobalt efflux system permease component RcnA
VALSSLPILSVFGLGLALGLRHALDADHLAAVSTIASERRNVIASSLAGAFWGLGHTVALLAVGVAVILLRIEIGPRTAAAAELCAALMLVGLGVDTLWKVARGGQLHLHRHRHGKRTHAHPHVHAGEAHDDPDRGDWHHGLRHQRRPFFVGMVHGLAGSAALMLIILAGLPSPSLAFTFITAFGIGSVGAMACMGALLGAPAVLTASRFRRVHVLVRSVAGVVSVVIGILMTYDVALAAGFIS